jgi:hypothetical protein
MLNEGRRVVDCVRWNVHVLICRCAVALSPFLFRQFDANTAGGLKSGGQFSFFSFKVVQSEDLSACCIDYATHSFLSSEFQMC